MKAQSVDILGLQDLPFIGSKLVFRMELPGGRRVFLSHDPSSSSLPVLVDAQALLELWRASPYEGHKYLAMGNPESWRKDSKFAQAEDGFRQGATNPVPIPGISTYARSRPAGPPVRAVTAGFWSRVIGHPLASPSRRSRTPEADGPTGDLERSISVSDCTRTIWMLANGAAWIPASANERSLADLLAWGVGIAVECGPGEAESSRRSSAPVGP